MNLSSRNKYVNSEKVLMLLFYKSCQQFQNDNLREKKGNKTTNVNTRKKMHEIFSDCEIS